MYLPYILRGIIDFWFRRSFRKISKLENISERKVEGGAFKMGGLLCDFGLDDVKVPES